MMSTRIITLAGDPEHEAPIAGQLTKRTDVELVLRCVDRGELLGSIRGGALDAIVSIGAPPWFDKQCATEAAARSVRVVGLTDNAFDAERLHSLGASILSLDAGTDKLVQACRSAPVAAHPPLGTPSLTKGNLIAVWGPKGAPGRTRIAIELAFQLAATEPQTLLIDGDPYGGDVLQLLGILDELPTVIWASRMAAKDELSAELLASELRRTDRSGPLVLPGLPRADLWAEVSDYGWRSLLEVAKASLRAVVCDVGFCLEPEISQFSEGDGRNRMARAAISSANHVVAVCRADPIGIKNFVWSFQQLADLTQVDDVVIVVNRTERSEEQELARLLRRYLDKRAVAYIPDRPALLAKAERQGASLLKLAGGADAAMAIRALADAIGGRVPSRGLLARVAGKRS